MLKEVLDYGYEPASFRKVINRFKKAYGENIPCPLVFENNMQLLVAVILSAQCTDEVVNKVTEKLFKKYKTAKDFALVEQETLEKEIFSTGFYRNKAKNIIAAAQKIQEDFGGNVPQTMQELLTLAGVARKTANVVLQEGFNHNSGVIVDTHVIRIARRLALTDKKDSSKIADDLEVLIPKKYWKDFSSWCKALGRAQCVGKPKCHKCPMKDICPHGKMVLFS